MSTQHWDFDLVHSGINFHVRHLMISKVHGRFQQWSGALEIDDADPTKSRIEVTIDAASIDTKEPKRDDHLRSADFLEVEKYPHITFKSTMIERKSESELVVHGELTLHGVARPVTLEVESAGTVKDPWGGTRTGFSAKTAISRKDFGLTWNTLLEAGGVAVADKVEITLEIEAIKKAATAAA
jgi:polyisoprenoid-binding protein YceI